MRHFGATVTRVGTPRRCSSGPSLWDGGEDRRGDAFGAKSRRDGGRTSFFGPLLTQKMHLDKDFCQDSSLPALQPLAKFSIHRK